MSAREVLFFQSGGIWQGISPSFKECFRFLVPLRKERRRIHAQHIEADSGKFLWIQWKNLCKSIWRTLAQRIHNKFKRRTLYILWGWIYWLVYRNFKVECQYGYFHAKPFAFWNLLLLMYAVAQNQTLQSFVMPCNDCRIFTFWF